MQERVQIRRSLPAFQRTQRLQLGFRYPPLLGVEDAARRQQRQQAHTTPDDDVASLGPIGIHPAGSLWDGGQKRDFRPSEILRWLVEIPAGGMDDTVAAIAVGRDAQVMAQNSIPAVTLSQQDRGARLDQLVPHGARCRMLHPHHLHGQG
jgi:hypothetical protein